MGGMTRCPCCGTAVNTPRPVVDLVSNVIAFERHSVHVAPKVAEFVSVLAQVYPSPIRKAALIARLWGVAEPASASETVRLLAWQARRATQGWPFTFRGTSAGYAMQRVS